MQNRPLFRLACAFLSAGIFGSSAFSVPFTIEGPNVDPDDFRVTVFASGLDFPLAMAELSDGSILVAINEGASFYASSGKLLRLADEDGDGVAETQQLLYNQLVGSQTGLQIGGSLVFVTGNGQPLTILRAGASPADPLSYIGRIDFQYPGGSTYHAHSTLELRPTPGVSDSYDLFFQIGSEHNFAPSERVVTFSSPDVSGASGSLEGASAYMMTIVDEGSTVRMESVKQIGTGLRNAAGFAFHPTTGDLYFQDNGIDGLVNVNEPHSADELNFIPRSEIGHLPVPDFGFPENFTAYRTGEVVGGEGVQPLMVFQPIPDPFTGRMSEGPNDVEFAPPGFPEGLNRGLFIGFHGIFNSGGMANNENPVVFADPETGEYFHFIRGQQAGLGHPNGLLATRDSLFVADMATGGNMGNAKGQGVIYQIRSMVPPTPPDLIVRRVDAGIELIWDRGRLQTTENLSDPWEDLSDVFSPLLLRPEGSKRFFRAIY